MFDKEEDKVVVVNRPVKKVEQKVEVPRKTDEEYLAELANAMFVFAEENQYDANLVFKWIEDQVIPENTKLKLGWTYASEITKIQTIQQIREEYICLKKL